MNIARKILERWGNKAIIILQSHSIWGDVFVYFEFKGEWYTLHLRTDAFTEASVKRNEHDLLTPGEIELFQGLKGVSHRFSLKSLSEEVLHQKVKALLQQVENTDWRMKGRVDLIMFSKLKKLNSLLKEMKRRNIDILDYLNLITTYIQNLITEYQRQPGRVTKRKIVRSFQGITLVEAQVNELAHALLGPISELETRRIKKPKPEKKSQRQTLTNSPTKLLFRGPITQTSTIEPASWIINLLKKIFSGKEITTNACEGTFGSIGMEIRRGRSTYLERALTKVMLQRKSIPETVEWFSKYYPISDMGKRGTRGSRKRILLNRRYKIEYTDRWNVKTQRTVDVIRRNGKWIEVYCHLRRDFRTLKRRKINILDSQ